ncbi:sugar-transfer associated ATP-grasp domain-containing protein [Salisediminibacterium beveridgei]|uniref:Hexapeptide Transferase Family Protein n=1 Tax=Salisediminibacterium beveridgei TaxID=632773 RepID=A0A1D7QSB5_9BACI|nr:sugar-transfer associated ATP-grasp domain-containing protein [Salisediminibacterium beveridgei]AOM81910.1 Hexapeptide Transferase Family Protein [Salisediminibacterium beveridgei]
MSNKRELEIKLINQSIKAIHFSVDSLNNEAYSDAIEMYNTVLKAYDSLIKLYEDYEGKNTYIPDQLRSIEADHKSVIKAFEKGEWRGLSNRIHSTILSTYKTLLETSLELKEFEEKNVNVYDKYYGMFKEAGYLENVTDEKLDRIQRYWRKHYGKEADPSFHLAYEHITGTLDERVVPQGFMFREIIPYLNDKSMMHFYKDKNVYDMLIDAENRPDSVLKCVNGQYFNADHLTISKGKALQTIFNTKEDLIIKHSLSDDGKGIGKLKFYKHAHYYNEKKLSLNEIEQVWGDNFIIQKVIKQHPVMAEPHKYSVNTVRIVTLRWNDSVHHLMSYARFGVGKSITDNAASEGMCIGIQPDGTFMNFSIGTDSKLHYVHPTTDFEFSKLGKIPDFEEVVESVLKLHDRILHENYVSWDIAIGLDGRPIFIEMNFWGATWKYQLSCQMPALGHFTEEILTAVKKDREKKQQVQQDKDRSLHTQT